MPTAISCLHPQLKLILKGEAHHISDDAERKVFLKLLEGITDCQGILIGLESGAGKAGRVKRKPSAYNEFMGQCARSKEKGGQGRDFKACALEWKKEHPKKGPQ